MDEAVLTDTSIRMDVSICIDDLRRLDAASRIEPSPPHDGDDSIYTTTTTTTNHNHSRKKHTTHETTCYTPLSLLSQIAFMLSIYDVHEHALSAEQQRQYRP